MSILTAGLTTLILKVLEKGFDNVIDAGFDDGAKGFQRLLKGSEAEQEFKSLLKIVEEVAEKEFSATKEEDKKLFSHKPFLLEIVSAILDPSSDFNFDELARDYQEKFSNYPGLPDKIEQFFNAIYMRLTRDKHFGKILTQIRTLYQNEEILKGLKEKELPVRESEIVSQEITNIDTNIENIETFINSYFHVEKYVEQENIYFITPDHEGQRLKENEEKALNQYFNQLKTYCYNLPLSALGDDDNRLMDVQLKEIYINLNTTAITTLEDIKNFQPDQVRFWGQAGKIELLELVSEDHDKKAKQSFPIPVYDAFRFSKRMILLGDPGSGKSTFAKYLLGQYIERELSKEDFEGDLLPVLINFREISRDLAQLDLKGKPADEQEKKLADKLKEKIQAKVCGDGCMDLTAYFEAQWHNGALFLVLDGLDEVPEDQRARIRQTVQAVEKTIHPKRILLTCRVRSYMGEAVLPNWYAFTLAPLDKEKINNFIKVWYDTTAPKLGVPKEQKDKRIEDLQAAARRDSLEELSGNPMLLTTMTLIHQKEAVLPDQRVKVYKQAVELLMRRWQRTQAGEFKVSEQLEYFLNKEERLYPLLEIIAYRAHQNPDRELDRYDLIKILENEANLKLDFIDEFLNYIDRRAGLLSGIGSEPDKPNLYKFPHRTFQEFLAACYLVGQRNYEQLLFEKAAEGDYWILVIQLSFEELKYNRRIEDKLSKTAYYLCPKGTRGGENHQRAALWAGLIVQELGVEYIKQDTYNPYGGDIFLEELRFTLADYLGQDLTPKEWAEAGEILAEIGDLRFYGKEQFYLPKDEKLGFVEVPAGEFWMGEDSALHQVALPTYYLSKTMVTVDQFRFFSETSEYTEFDPGALKDKSNQPVRYVTWYNAIKYCEWLQKELIKSTETPVWIREKINQGWRITLPSEAEWEKAARGNTQNKYPWGNEINPEEANYWDTQIDGPSAVGCFPGHGLIEQFYDLSGNLWEWTRSKYEKYPYKSDERDSLKGKGERVLRGGYYGRNGDILRCANRFRCNPLDGFFNYGFRIVLSPPPLGSGPSGR